ncbi:MAG: hypothetical protein ACI85O_003719 [Saprospiraceae bacterium]|jgi:hypothetical protein
MGSSGTNGKLLKMRRIKTESFSLIEIAILREALTLDIETDNDADAAKTSLLDKLNNFRNELQ